MDCDGCGFNKRALLKAHVLRELIAVVLREGVVPRQGTVVGRCRSEGHVRAKVVLALLAPYAAAAGDTRLHGDAVADLQCLDLTADLFDDTCGLVAENHGLLDDEVADSAFNPVVDI